MALRKWFTAALIFVLFSCLPTSQAKCGGRTILTDLQGTIHDGPSDYPRNTLCEWLIKGPYPNVSITLKFIEYITECSYDYMFIHDGDSYLSPLIASISGNNSVQTVVAHSGQMLINLYSDYNYVLDGFVANYTIENCTQGCSGHGICKDGFCQCDNLWRGKACDLEACPTLCLEGQGQGHCNYSQGHCVCNHGFIGESCSLSTLTDFKSNNWFTISSTSFIFSPRIAHSVVYIKKSDTLLAFGGYSLNTVFDNLLQFDFTTSLWSELHAGSPKPVGRFSHSAGLYLDSMVLFGGELQNGSLNNDLWLYNITQNKWTELAVNDVTKPPPLAEHTATIVDDKLYIFGGRTMSDPFSSAMYSYSLSSQTGWTKILYNRGNELHLRMLGHTTVYYADLRSLIVFGGFVPNRASLSDRSNRLLAFHLDLHVWSELSVAGDIPSGRSFHSAVLVGDYMVIYGGNVHQHYGEEICHENKLLFYHLKCHKWISPQTFNALSPSTSNPQQGRFSHGAVIRNGTVMLVVGGYSGLPLGDVLGFKLPIAIAEKSSVGGHCEGYSTEKSCKDDPECGWCKTSPKCLSLDQSGSCGSSLLTGSCPGPCAAYLQCSACLSFGSTKCGWCVQDSRCYPIGSPTGACQSAGNSNQETVRGWWGNTGQFLTSPNQCQTTDFPPGITVVENVQTPNSSFPDGVRIVSKSEVKILRSGISEVDRVQVTQLIGFIYPFKYQSVPWKAYELTLMIDNAQHSEAKLWLSTDDTEANSELVAHCKEPSDGTCSAKAVRTNKQPLFPSPSEGKRYYIRAEVNKEIDSQMDYRDSDFSLKWNRTSSTFVREPLSAQFLQPYTSSDCSVYTTCLACMTDASCGWCVTSCMSRNTPAGSCQDSDGNPRNMTLNAAECTVCSDHVDCHSCVEGGDCVWGTGSYLGCFRRGQLVTNVIQNCSSPCSSRKTCSSCLSDKTGCTWCDKTQSCFVFGTYITRYPFGQCSHWIDSRGQCSNCSKHTTCKSCLEDVRCGWCGNDYDPRIGRCYAGDFSAPYSGQCSNIFPTNGSTVWSYSECPDVDECMLGIAQCHHNASCVNVPDSFNCICNRGFTGDGTVACNKTCYHDCGVHGVCGPDFKCDCDLGWLGENCTTDCGCYGHSDCSQGIGICDECQDHTQGTHCEFCIPGTFGNATTAEGCKPCQCNGHGDPDHDLCDMATGKCFCTDFTMGDNCEKCMPGLVGNPRNGGLCFHECKTRSILTNITQGFISTQLGSGVTNKAKASCLWLISSLTNSSHNVVYGPSPPPVESRGDITLTFKEMKINCATDHVEVYDGLPPFLLGVHSEVQSFYQLGSFCGWNEATPKAVTARLGNMVVLIKADLSSGALSKTFSAKFTIKKCPDLCNGNQKCVMSSDGAQCVCLEGWSGDNCDQLVCPNNCSLAKGQGQCNLTLGGCVCSDGFTGPDCSQVISPGRGLWEALSYRLHPNISTDYLARMGHTMVHGPGVLLVFAGYSFTYGLLDDLQSFNLSSNTWSLVEVNQLESSIPSVRYLHSAVFHTDSMLIYGGLTQNGADDSLWSFNLTSLRWNKLSSKGPKVAGHTATLAGDDMLIIGGYDRIQGFSERSYKYNIVTKKWTNLTTTGPSPKGIYGHTAVNYATKGIILVFGGYRFRIHTMSASDELYSLELATSKWSVLQALPHNEPRPKYFHSAAILDDYMVVFGGRSNTTDQLFSHQLLLYNIKCNYWHLLSDNNLLGSKPGGLLSAAAIQISGKVFLFGGFDGQTQATLSRLTLPSDLCHGMTSKQDCTAVKTCSWCEVYNVTQGGNVTIATNKSACYSVTSPLPAVCHVEPNVTQVVHHNGTDCSGPADRTCGTFYSCSTCLASFPYPSSKPSCKWCFGCRTGGKCIKPSENCNQVHPCQNQTQVTPITSDDCNGNSCEATTCSTCLGLNNNCLWTNRLRWRSEALLGLSHPIYPVSWNCWGNLAEDDRAQIEPKSPPGPCPQPCTSHKNCSACLQSHGADGAWKECVWSETLGQCFSPSYLPLICLAGRCGRVIRGSDGGCMDSCLNNDRCSTCMTSYNCGWCSKHAISGEGHCYEGGLHGPLHETCDGRNTSNHVARVWASTLCPLENECLNGRHNCNLTTQVCVDLPHSFKCVCRPGYSDTGHPGTCLPVCSKGCLQGSCVLPEVCDCNFGWTAANCSVKCLCNEHGQCANETHLDVCHDCQNNTVGQSCEFCKALYVGDARNNGTCVSCSDTCNHRANVCMNSTQLKYGRDRNFSFEYDEVKRWLKHGPYKIEREEECLCKNNSKGLKCGSCVSGFFNLQDSCTRCQCNGHADSCDEKGICSCLNNTMEDCPSSSDCYKNQCIKCKENFMGNPINNQQCYRKISVMQEFVIGSEPADTEKKQDKPLPYGRAIFYAIYPRYTNVDIRMTIDMFAGAVDVYAANENDEFTVIFNETSEEHQVNIRSPSSSRSRRKRDTEKDISYNSVDDVDEVTTSNERLNTFVSYNEAHRALIVRDVRNRLILTFPHADHHLRDTRFYLAFIGRDKSGAKGLVYFRQDQSQIDLFVFFSVFFSAFFLVVSVVVFGWKIKQYHTRRRVIEVREHQLETMRSRPFATYSFLCQMKRPQPSCWRVKRDMAAVLLRDSSLVREPHQLRLRDVRERPVIAPVSQEPTGDGRACVTTVVFQLPGNECSDFQLLLGSALTVVTNQHSLGGAEHHPQNGRKFGTRRTVTFTS
ncbi:multiple epidermal growth factor-like domains protein 8 isoform X1 [Oculina patagonica]